RTLVLDSTDVADRIPHRKRHAEEALAADAPVAVEAVHPVLVTRLHVLRMPFQLAAPHEQSVAELDRLDEPLTARDDLERPIAFLVELHGVRDRARFGDEISAAAKLFDYFLPRLRRGKARDVVVEALPVYGIDRLPRRLAPRHLAQRAVRLNDRAHPQTELAPPRHVGDVAERADHRDAGRLLGIGEGVRLH